MLVFLGLSNLGSSPVLILYFCFDLFFSFGLVIFYLIRVKYLDSPCGFVK
ncbi:hypothetical protein HanIR_Chr07g0330501 [Helianthus annuus]|nr:hypothetical protein HanIR_Chr07g0330501 [Helianthus annuus]